MEKDDDSPSIIWEGEGVDEIGRRGDNNDTVIKIDKRYFRPTEVNHLLGNAEKAKNKLGWEAKTSLEEMIAEMVQEDEKIISSMKLK